jgi:hypothetical protein
MFVIPAKPRRIGPPKPRKRVGRAYKPKPKADWGDVGRPMAQPWECYPPDRVPREGLTPPACFPCPTSWRLYLAAVPLYRVPPLAELEAAGRKRACQDCPAGYREQMVRVGRCERERPIKHANRPAVSLAVSFHVNATSA